MTDPVLEPEPEEALRDMGIEVLEGDISIRPSAEGFGVIVDGADEEDEEKV
jgi:hypothetical protein